MEPSQKRPKHTSQLCTLCFEEHDDFVTMPCFINHSICIACFKPYLKSKKVDIDCPTCRRVLWKTPKIRKRDSYTPQQMTAYDIRNDHTLETSERDPDAFSAYSEKTINTIRQTFPNDDRYLLHIIQNYFEIPEMTTYLIDIANMYPVGKLFNNPNYFKDIIVPTKEILQNIRHSQPVLYQQKRIFFDLLFLNIKNMSWDTLYYHTLNIIKTKDIVYEPIISDQFLTDPRFVEILNDYPTFDELLTILEFDIPQKIYDILHVDTIMIMLEHLHTSLRNKPIVTKIMQTRQEISIVRQAMKTPIINPDHSSNTTFCNCYAHNMCIKSIVYRFKHDKEYDGIACKNLIKSIKIRPDFLIYQLIQFDPPKQRKYIDYLYEDINIFDPTSVLQQVLLSTHSYLAYLLFKKVDGYYNDIKHFMACEIWDILNETHYRKKEKYHRMKIAYPIFKQMLTDIGSIRLQNPATKLIINAVNCLADEQEKIYLKFITGTFTETPSKSIVLKLIEEGHEDMLKPFLKKLSTYQPVLFSNAILPYLLSIRSTLMNYALPLCSIINNNLVYFLNDLDFNLFFTFPNVFGTSSFPERYYKHITYTDNDELYFHYVKTYFNSDQSSLITHFDNRNLITLVRRIKEHPITDKAIIQDAIARMDFDLVIHHVYDDNSNLFKHELFNIPEILTKAILTHKNERYLDNIFSTSHFYGNKTGLTPKYLDQISNKLLIGEIFLSNQSSYRIEEIVKYFEQEFNHLFLYACANIHHRNSFFDNIPTNITPTPEMIQQGFSIAIQHKNGTAINYFLRNHSKNIIIPDNLLSIIPTINPTVYTRTLFI